MRGFWDGRRSERGSTIAIMAVMLFAMLAMAAFAIDLASLRSARSETQRAADAIALAGASAFYDLPSGDATATDEAQTRALDIARLNVVRGDTLYVDNPVVSPSPTPTPAAAGQDVQEPRT